MNAVETKINYFRSKLDEIKRTEVALKIVTEKYNREYSEWLIEQGMPEQFTQLDLIAHFLKKKSVEIIT